MIIYKKHFLKLMPKSTPSFPKIWKIWKYGKFSWNLAFLFLHFWRSYLVLNHVQHIFAGKMSGVLLVEQSYKRYMCWKKERTNIISFFRWFFASKISCSNCFSIVSFKGSNNGLGMRFYNEKLSSLAFWCFFLLFLL